jgi:hypothetical protein
MPIRLEFRCEIAYLFGADDQKYDAAGSRPNRRF